VVGRANNDSCTAPVIRLLSTTILLIEEEERGWDHWAWSSRREKSTSWTLHVWTVARITRGKSFPKDGPNSNEYSNAKEAKKKKVISHQSCGRAYSDLDIDGTGWSTYSAWLVCFFPLEKALFRWDLSMRWGREAHMWPKHIAEVDSICLVPPNYSVDGHLLFSRNP
jgi:hypothetical protein